MKGDFSRDSFDRTRGFTRVLQQQGRVELDADGNERQSIQLHLLRALAADLIGPHGGTGDSFKISRSAGESNFTIASGHYYADGLLCENDAPVLYEAGPTADKKAQPWVPAVPNALRQPPKAEPGKPFFVYLDVWERHVTATEGAALREVALGGPDTASRAQLVWQVKIMPDDNIPAVPAPPTPTSLRKHYDELAPGLFADFEKERGAIKAWTALPGDAKKVTPCLVSPSARYRGLENQLYRVEVRRSGPAGTATFAWSRENGAVTFAVAEIAGEQVRLQEGWHDARFGIAVGDFVEVADAVSVLTSRADDLYRVTAYDRDTLTVTLGATPVINTDDPGRAVILRVWNHQARPDSKSPPVLANDNALTVVEGQPLPLEDGIVIEFVPSITPEPMTYRSGDYWLIPARTALADIIWPRDANNDPKAVPPHGIDHHYAPLALIGFPGGSDVIDLRKKIKPMASF